MNCGLQSVNLTFPCTHLWPSQLQLVSILSMPHAKQSCLCLAELVKLEYSRRGVPWSETLLFPLWPHFAFLCSGYQDSL